MEAIPYGPEDVDDPEFASLTEDDIPDGVWFQYWMGIKKSLYFCRQNHSVMSERSVLGARCSVLGARCSVLAWLGFLLGELEGGGISTAEYDKLRALLPPVTDDLTPLVAASQ
jgi:hypothetical protein